MGIVMVQPLILQYYQLLPEHRFEEEASDWPRQFRKALLRYKRSVEARYNESTLERLLYSPDAEVRQAAILALGMLGSIRINQTVAHRLHDEDPTVRQLTENALWSIWFRADPENHQELQRLSAGILKRMHIAQLDGHGIAFFNRRGFSARLTHRDVFTSIKTVSAAQKRNCIARARLCDGLQCFSWRGNNDANSGGAARCRKRRLSLRA